MDKVFNSQHRAQMQNHFRAIVVGNTLRLINENTNNWLVLGASNLNMNQLHAVVDCHLFSDCLNPLRNRILCHFHPREVCCPKEKVGANPPDKNPCLRASCGLYGKQMVEATATQGPGSSNASASIGLFRLIFLPLKG